MHVQFAELANLIASALHPLSDNATEHEMMSYGVARINLEAELPQAARLGVLPVKDPSTFGPHSFPVGNALQTALVSVNDLRVFLAGRPITVEVAQAQNPATPTPEVAASDATPWLSIDPHDPAPELSWYTPARYFARQLTIETPALLANRPRLADKVSTALFNAGFKKRGGIKKFNSNTVLKAFANVTLG